MSIAALIVPVLVQAVAPAPAVFAPPLDRPILYVVSEVREDGRQTQRFAIERRVVFRRAINGYIAETETLAVSGDGGGATKLFAGMARGMVGRRVIVTLGPAGEALDVADLDAHWDAQLAAMTATLATKDAARAAVTDSLLAPLRALPRAGKVARLADAIAPLIATGSPRPAPEHEVVLPARAQDGTSHALTGTERVVALPDGSLLLDRKVGATLAGSTMAMTLQRRIDPRTGMIVSSTGVDEFTNADARLTITRTTTLKP